MSAANPATYEQITIESNDQERTADLRMGTVAFDYYEDIFSPTITARVRVVNTGDSMSPKDATDPKKTDGAKQSIYNGLPLRGGERVIIKILDKGNSYNGGEKNGIDFAKDVKKYMYVSSITDVISETQRETFLLNLVSREAITNETTRVFRKYTGSIADSVEKILTDTLKVSRSRLYMDDTSNKYGFIGNNRKPFSVITWLASKSVPKSSGDGTAGFLFYQTQDGFQFRSIDDMIKEDSVATYVYTEVTKSSIERNNDYRILKYNVDKNQDLLKKLRLGTYSSQRMFFNPNTFTFTNPERGKFRLQDDKIKNLGKKKVKSELPKISDESERTLDDLPTRILSGVIDIGTMDQGVSQEENADPSKYQAQAIMRYNVLFTQTLSMTVPCNTDLRAGNIITCEFPKISRKDSVELDPDTSGKYIIKELCHHFDPDGSYTSMKLIRDTFGFYGS
tara:strand:- start:8507 stop:9859 length:1353 start_codon:yes stop_codon:yes gene_type:complete